MTLAIEQNRLLADKCGIGFDTTRVMMAMAEEDDDTTFTDDYDYEFEEVGE